ncbi:unnamed protein product, partial [Amoebophrya sp. A120]
LDGAALDVSGTSAGSSDEACGMTFASSSVVVRHLREIRPGSIETDHQERFVRSYADRLWRSIGDEQDKTSDFVVPEAPSFSTTSDHHLP